MILTWHLESSIFSDPGVYFAGGRGQGRLAVASTNVYMFNSVVRGHHCIAFIYQAIESHSLTKHYKCMMQEGTAKHDKYTVENPEIDCSY